MLTKPIFMSKKAISPILATLLLIVIAVAAIVVTYAWIMTYMGTAGQHAGVTLYKANVRFYDSGTKIDIDIGNSGTSDTQIILVYVGLSSTDLQNKTTTPALPVALAGGSIARITVSHNWTAGIRYYFKIVSASAGISIEFSEQAPQGP